MKIQNAFRLGLIGTLGAGLGVLILMSIVSLATILTYIGAALFLALGIEPVISFLERHGFKRWLALLVTMVVLLAAIAGLVWAIVPVIVDQSSQAIEGITKWVQSGAALDLFHQAQQQFPTVVNQDNLDAIVTYAQENAGKIGGGVLQVGLGIISGVFGALIVIILTM